MTKDARAMPFCLPSGAWHGYYEQFGRRFPQGQVMEFADGIVRGDGRDVIGDFRIEGRYREHRDSVRIGWIKTYVGAHSVLYLGRFDGTWLRGSWQIEAGEEDAFGLQPRAAS